MPQSNFETLMEAGAIANPNDVSEEHKKIINNDFTPDEIRALIKLKDKITGLPFASDPGAGQKTGMAAV